MPNASYLIEKTLTLKNQSFVEESELIIACKKQDRRAQQMLYEQFSPAMFGLLKRYMRTREDAEDVLVEAFFKVLTNIEQYQSKGPFGGWVRRIVINEALMALRKKHNFNLTVEIEHHDVPAAPKVVDRLAANDILQLLDQLPTGYRTVFNLYVIEGYKHREIAELLGISINTSKSQLILAKKKMQSLLARRAHPDARATEK